MTDEEKAEEYTDNINTIIYDIEDNAIDIAKYLRKAYLDGLVEGKKEKWHNMRENPDDLPPRINRLSETVINEIGTPCHYNFEKSCWQNWSYIDIETPIAWCELPKFEED